MTTTTRVRGEDKRLINGNTDVNQLMPIKYKWAWDHYETGLKNHWVPSGIPMTQDAALWRDKAALTDDERLVVLRNLGFFATAETTIANNLTLALMRHISAAEVRQFLLRQAFEECYSEDTEVLTPRGWVAFPELTDTDKVAQYGEDGTVSFVLPTARTKQFRDQDLIGFWNDRGHVDLLVTPGHRMVGVDETGGIVTGEAETFSYSHKECLVAGLKVGGEKTALTPHERFLIAFQADGSIPTQGEGYPNRDGSRCGYVAVTFTFKKRRKIERLRQILRDAGYAWVESDPDPRGRIVFRVTLPEYPAKTIDWVDLEAVSGNWCREFVEEVAHWDGHHDYNGGTRIGYWSTDEESAKTVQAVAVLAGYRCHWALDEDNRSETFSDGYSVSIVRDRDRLCRGVVRKARVPYRGDVYCVTVPSGMLLVRRNGCVVVCGNCIHAHMFLHIVDSLGFGDEQVAEIFNMYREIPSVAAKDEFIVRHTKELSDPTFSTASPAGIRTLLKNLVAQYVCMEGLFFYSGFVMNLNFMRRNLLSGIAQQYSYTMRDEAVHVAFGVDLIRGIRAENPGVWDADLDAEVYAMMEEAKGLEAAYARDVLPRGVMGLNAEMFDDYIGHIADRRLGMLGLAPRYGTDNPFPWMSETMDLTKEKNFFETRVVDYQHADTFKWD